MARKRRGRPVNGILLLNKPQGVTSNRILQMAKRHFYAAKAGHTGSLDPLATGLLPICFGEATKFSQYLLDADKTYRVTAKLGERTDSADADGTVIETKPIEFTESRFHDVLEQFTGDIMQTPSMFSALKKDGQPLYKLARQGITVERDARPVTIYSIQCLSLTDDTFSLEVACSKGTYIRNLVDDIGEELGCGAHVTVLERIASGHFSHENWHDWDALEKITDYEQLDACLLPVDAMVPNLPSIILTDDESYYMLHGQPITMSDLPEADFIRIYDDEENFLGLAHVNDDGQLAPKRMIASA